MQSDHEAKPLWLCCFSLPRKKKGKLDRLHSPRLAELSNMIRNEERCGFLSPLFQPPFVVFSLCACGIDSDFRKSVVTLSARTQRDHACVLCLEDTCIMKLVNGTNFHATLDFNQSVEYWRNSRPRRESRESKAAVLHLEICRLRPRQSSFEDCCWDRFLEQTQPLSSRYGIYTSALFTGLSIGLSDVQRPTTHASTEE